jgi:phospholipid/cholesterol/gamma-HCH transport system substrate-binding protein
MSALKGRTVTNLAVVIVVSMLVLAAAGFRFLGTFGTDDREVAVELPASGGVLAGQPVTVRGTGVGVVSDVGLTSDGVRIQMDINRDRAVPRHVFVQVLRRSPIGEQAVELTPAPADWEPDGDDAFAARDVPRAEGWPALEEGEEFDVRGVSVPASVPEVLRLAQDLITSIDEEALSTVLGELGAAFDGRDQVLRDLTDDAVGVSDTLLAASGDIERLLEVSEPTLRTIHDQRDELRAGLSSSADLLETLAAREDDVAAILESAPGALDEVTRLVDQQAANFHCLNRDLLAVGQLLAGDDVLPFLAQLLDNQRFFYGSFDAGTQWDPFRPQAVWARVNILFLEESGAQAKDPRTPTPPTLPGAHCDSPFGLGVDAVRQADPDPMPPDPTSPGIEYAPEQEGADDRADHTVIERDRDARRP